MKTWKISLRPVSALIIAIAVIAGCEKDSLKNPVEPSAVIQNKGSKVLADVASGQGERQIEIETPDSPTGCTNASGVIPTTPSYQLNNLGSSLWFPAGSVLSPTVLSFDICDLDTTGTKFSPKVQVLGPDPNFGYLKDVRVDLALADAGLPSSTPPGTDFSVYRWTLAGDWVLHATDIVRANGLNRYWIVQNGMYVISLDSTLTSPIDTSWTVSGDVDPLTGGTLNLLYSSLIVPPGAVNTTTNITFTMTVARPQGLPNALERIYEFSPDGIVFQVPVILYVSFTDAGLINTTREDDATGIKFYYFDEANSLWVQQPTIVDQDNQRFFVQLSHFSRYAFAR